MILRLQRYVLFEVLKLLVLAVVGVSAVILIILCVRLMNEGLRPSHLRGFLIYLVPYVFPFSVPSGMLIATVMAFGRLAGDNELMAIRSSGVSLRRVIWPVVAVGGLLALGSMELNNDVLPACRKQVDRKQADLLRTLRVEDFVGEGKGLELPPYVVNIAGVDPQDPSRWQHVLAVKYAGDHVVQVIIAQYGRIALDRETGRGTLLLEDGIIVQRGEGWNELRFDRQTYTVDLNRELAARQDASRMGLRDLLARRAELADRLAGAEPARRPRMMRRRLEAEIFTLTRERNRIRRRRNIHRGEVGRLDAQAEALASTRKGLRQRQEALMSQMGRQRSRLRQAEADVQAVLAVLKTVRRPDSDFAKRLLVRLREHQRARDQARAALETSAKEMAGVASRLEQVQQEYAQNRAKAVSESRLADQYEAELRPVEERIKAAERRRALMRDQERIRDVVLQIHFRLAQSLACLVFALVGIPLGTLCGRGGVVVAFGVSFAVVIFLYYPVYSVSKKLAQNGHLNPVVAMWLPNLVCAVIGGILLWRTLRR